MPTMRSTRELEALRAEAERRVRLGESRAEVARSLGVAATTVSQWALRHGWRKKDLEAENDGELTSQADALVARLRAQTAASKSKTRRLKARARKTLDAVELARSMARAEQDGARGELREALLAAEAAMAEIEALQRELRAEAAGDRAGERDGDRAGDHAGEGGDAGEGEEERVGVNGRDVTVSALERAHALLEDGKLEEAERAARVAWRMRTTADRLEVREERLRLLFEEKLVKAAEARRKAVTPGFYPDRDAANYEEKIGICVQVIRRLAFLERRAPAEVEAEYTGGYGFRWPGAGAPWFKAGCMRGTFEDDEAPAAPSFAEAWPEEEGREASLAEEAEAVDLRGRLRLWASEADPFNREWRIAKAAERGELAWLRRHAPEMWKGLVLEEAPAE